MTPVSETHSLGLEITRASMHNEHSIPGIMHPERVHLTHETQLCLPGCRNLCLARSEIMDLEVEVAAGLAEEAEAGGLAEEDHPGPRK